MKRLIFLIVSVLLVVCTLCACNKTITPEQGSAITQSPDTTIESETASTQTAVVILQAGTTNPSEAEKNTVVSVYKTRLNNAGYTEATVQIVDRNEPFRVIVTVPNADPQAVAELLIPRVNIVFCDASGYEVSNGTDIFSATYEYRQQPGSSSSAHHIVLTLTDQGLKKFSVASANAASLQPAGLNYISIFMDEKEISRLIVTQALTEKEVVISGNFSLKTAQGLANLISAGSLPFSMTMVSCESTL